MRTLSPVTNDEDALRIPLVLSSAGVTRLLTMTVRTTRPFDLPHRHAPFVASSRRSRPTDRRVVRLRRIATIAATICLVPALVSYIGALTGRSDSSIGIRTVEWLRDNGGRGLVDRVENLYYSLTAPSQGGPPLIALPRQSGAVAATPV